MLDGMRGAVLHVDLGGQVGGVGWIVRGEEVPSKELVGELGSL